MKEIGGYLELESLIHNEFYPDAIKLNTARNALVYLVKAKKIEKVYLPYYLCDSVFKVCDREDIPYEFYHTDSEFLPMFNKELCENEYIYIVNYYGQLSNDKLKNYKNTYKNIIVDNVQAFFTPPLQEVDTIYSCRKFFGVPDGAYLVSDAPKLAINTDTSNNRMKHILGRYDERDASKYYSNFQDNDLMFEKLPEMYMSRLTQNILGAIDYEFVARKRKENWEFLFAILQDKNRLNLIIPEGPYMYPFYCNNACSVRKKLAERNIYIPKLWSNVKDSGGSNIETDYAENILPLPIDQRYNKEDMQRLTEELLNTI